MGIDPATRKYAPLDMNEMCTTCFTMRVRREFGPTWNGKRGLQRDIDGIAAASPWPQMMLFTPHVRPGIHKGVSESGGELAGDRNAEGHGERALLH